MKQYVNSSVQSKSKTKVKKESIDKSISHYSKSYLTVDDYNRGVNISHSNQVNNSNKGSHNKVNKSLIQNIPKSNLLNTRLIEAFQRNKVKSKDKSYDKISTDGKKRQNSKNMNNMNNMITMSYETEPNLVKHTHINSRNINLKNIKTQNSVQLSNHSLLPFRTLNEKSNPNSKNKEIKGSFLSKKNIENTYHQLKTMTICSSEKRLKCQKIGTLNVKSVLCKLQTKKPNNVNISTKPTNSTNQLHTLSTIKSNLQTDENRKSKHEKSAHPVKTQNSTDALSNNNQPYAEEKNTQTFSLRLSNPKKLEHSKQSCSQKKSTALSNQKIHNGNSSTNLTAVSNQEKAIGNLNKLINKNNVKFSEQGECKKVFAQRILSFLKGILSDIANDQNLSKTSKYGIFNVPLIEDIFTKFIEPINENSNLNSNANFKSLIRSAKLKFNEVINNQHISNQNHFETIHDESNHNTIGFKDLNYNINLKNIENGVGKIEENQSMREEIKALKNKIESLTKDLNILKSQKNRFNHQNIYDKKYHERCISSKLNSNSNSNNRSIDFGKDKKNLKASNNSTNKLLTENNSLSIFHGVEVSNSKSKKETLNYSSDDDIKHELKNNTQKNEIINETAEVDETSRINFQLDQSRRRITPNDSSSNRIKRRESHEEIVLDSRNSLYKNALKSEPRDRDKLVLSEVLHHEIENEVPFSKEKNIAVVDTVDTGEGKNIDKEEEYDDIEDDIYIKPENVSKYYKSYNTTHIGKSDVKGKFNLNLNMNEMGSNSEKIYSDYNEEFLANYNEFSESWRKGIRNMRTLTGYHNK